MTLAASGPEGSRHKGYEEIIVQDIAFKPEVTLYRRERYATPDGRTVTADLPAGIVAAAARICIAWFWCCIFRAR